MFAPTILRDFNIQKKERNEYLLTRFARRCCIICNERRRKEIKFEMIGV
jgi:hypothetical protein